MLELISHHCPTIPCLSPHLLRFLYSFSIGQRQDSVLDEEIIDSNWVNNTKKYQKHHIYLGLCIAFLTGALESLNQAVN